MAFTDHCDLYAAVHEDGVNRVINHIMRQRPSWFNYATQDIALDPELWCEGIEISGDVTKYLNPLFTVLPNLPVIGTDAPPVSVGFCVQVFGVEIDFHPSNTLSLPPQLEPPLHHQRFALNFRVCGAVACPPGDDLNKMPVYGSSFFQDLPDVEIPPTVHVSGSLNCFCLDVFLTGRFDREVILGKERLLGKVDNIEIVDIAPTALEDNIECYLKTVVTLVLRQKLAIPLATFFYSFPLFNNASVTLKPTSNPPVPNNPAIEDDQLKAFISMTVTP